MENEVAENFYFFGTKWTQGSLDDFQNSFLIGTSIVFAIYFSIKLIRKIINTDKYEDIDYVVAIFIGTIAGEALKRNRL